MTYYDDKKKAYHYVLTQLKDANGAEVEISRLANSLLLKFGFGKLTLAKILSTMQEANIITLSEFTAQLRV